MATQSANAKALLEKAKAKGRSPKRIEETMKVLASDSISTASENAARLKASIRRNKRRNKTKKPGAQ